jgi:beta-glucosidase
MRSTIPSYTFERVSLSAGEKKTINFELPASMLNFYNQAMENTVEPGRFKLWIARHSADEENETSFEVVE